MRTFKLVLVIMAFVVLFSVNISAEVLPQDVRDALDTALADPPVTCQFLEGIAKDSMILCYLKKIQRLSFEFDEGNIHFQKEEEGYIRILIEVDGRYCKLSDSKIVSTYLFADVNDVPNAANFLETLRESEFWAAMIEALKVD